MELVILTALIIGLFGFFFLYISKVLKTSSTEDAKEEEHDVAAEGKKAPTSTAASSKRKGQVDRKANQAKDKFTHPWLLTTLKGHSGRVHDMDLSDNGKYLASCAEDRSVLVWMVKEFGLKEHKSHRGNVNYDMATKVKWSPDSKAYIVHKASENASEVYKISRRDDGGMGPVTAVVSFPCKHDTDVVGMGIAATGQYVMSCSDKTTLIIWNLKGEVLSQLDTYHMNTYCAKVSPCGRFVASSGFTPDVKVWEVKFSRTGEFEKVNKAFDLTGHTSGIFHFDFNGDSSRMVTLSKDNTWRLYDTNIEFAKGQDPTCLQKGTFDSPSTESIVALSPDAEVVAIANKNKIYWYDASSAELIDVVEHPHSEGVSCILFDKESRWLLTSGDKHIRVFNNVPGYKVRLRQLKEKLRTANTAGMKERLEKQVSELSDKLKTILA